MPEKFQHLSGSRALVAQTARGLVSNPRTALLLISVSFLAAGLLLAWPALNAPFFWDDLHNVRVHTAEELSRVWTGTYDPDHIESYGFRPLTVTFDHLRSLAFGEDVVAHRVFLVVLFSVYLTLAGAVAQRVFATTFWPLLLSGLLAFSHITSVNHYIWINDGIYFPGGILILAAILSLLQALSSGQARHLFASFLWSVLALLVRDDSVIVYPLLLWFAVAFAWLQHDRHQPIAWRRLPLVLFAAAMLGALLMYWYWRSAVVPQARSLAIDLGGLFWAGTRIVQDAGALSDVIHPWRAYEILNWSWQAWLGVFIVVGALALTRRERKHVLFWVGAATIAALPNLEVARSNTQLLPVTFWASLIASVLAALWNRSTAHLSRFLALGMALFAFGASAYVSFVFEQEMRPNNLTWMCRNATLLYGILGPATIPAARRESVQQELTAYGISDLADFKARWPSMERKALADGRFGVNAQGLPFPARFEFLPQFQSHPHCEPPD